MKTIGVFLVDDHSVLREALRLLIDTQSDMNVVGEAESGRDVSSAIRDSGADVVVLDVSMPDMLGSIAASDIREAVPAAKIVALTRHSEHAYVQLMMKAGAAAYVLKQTAASVLMTAIRAVSRGETFLDPVIALKEEEDTAVSHPASSDAQQLTSREREVLTMVAYGHTNKEIATVLGISVKTVESHKTNLMQKLGITSRAELVRLALSEGWLQSE